jgi:ABC-type antimicrobial peptide transport system permease subunit
MLEEQESDNSKTIAVITVIIVVALGMTAIGMISNQLIGFEGRKKECAVMLATSMNKGKLSGVLLKEVLITSVTASAVGTIVGTVLTMVIKAALDNAESVVVDLKTDPLITLLFFVILTVVFTATVLFPVKNLRKMKISEQIKYE